MSQTTSDVLLLAQRAGACVEGVQFAVARLQQPLGKVVAEMRPEFAAWVCITLANQLDEEARIIFSTRAAMTPETAAQVWQNCSKLSEAEARTLISATIKMETLHKQIKEKGLKPQNPALAVIDWVKHIPAEVNNG